MKVERPRVLSVDSVDSPLGQASKSSRSGPTEVSPRRLPGALSSLRTERDSYPSFGSASRQRLQWRSMFARSLPVAWAMQQA